MYHFGGDVDNEASCTYVRIVSIWEIFVFALNFAMNLNLSYKIKSLKKVGGCYVVYISCINFNYGVLMGVLMVIFYFNQSFTFINWNISVRKICPFSICFLNYLFKLLPYLCCLLRLFQCSHGKLMLATVHFNMLHHFLKYIFTFVTTRYFRNILKFAFSSLRMTWLFKDLWFTLWRKKDLHATHAFCSFDAFDLEFLSD